MKRAGRGAGLLLVLLLVLPACTLELDVNVELEQDGSGVVEAAARLDREAVQRIGGDLEAILALDDMRAEGWSVDGPSEAEDGSVTVRLSQPFTDPEGAAEVFDSLAAGGTPFGDMAVRRSQGLLQTKWRFDGTVDLGGSVPVPVGGEDDVTLDGEPVAETLSQLEDQLGQSLDRLLRLRVGVRLPGDVDSNATTRADNGAVWQFRFGEGPLHMEATGTSTRTGVVALLVIGGLLLVVGSVALLIRLAMRRTQGNL